MKGKNVFFALGLSLVVGFSAAIALGTTKAAQKAEAWDSDHWSHIYIIGSFAESGESTFLELTSSGGDYERIVQMTAGDWFKFTNQASWGDIEVARNWGQISSQACWTSLTDDGGGTDHNFVIKNTGTYRVYMEKAALESTGDAKWSEAEYGIHIEEYVEKQDPAAETNSFLILDEYYVLGDDVDALNVYGFGQADNIKEMAWPGTGTVEEHATDILPTYQGQISTSYPKIIINNGTRQTVDITDFEENYSTKILSILNTTDEHDHFNYEWVDPATIDRPSEVGYYISSAGLWDYAHADKMTNTDQGGNVAYYMGLQLNVGALIRIRSFYTDRSPFDQWADFGGEETAHWVQQDDNLYIKVSGKYDLYAKYEDTHFVFYIADHIDEFEVSITAKLYEGGTLVETRDLTAQTAYANADFEPNFDSIEGYVGYGVFTDANCSTGYTPTTFDADGQLYLRYMRTGYYMAGDATFTGSNDTAWKVEGSTRLSTDVLDNQNFLEGSVTIPNSASAEHPVKAKPLHYIGGSENNGWEAAGYTVPTASDYSFLDSEHPVDADSNLVFVKGGTYAVYVNNSGEIYLSEGLEAFYTKFLSEVGGVCQEILNGTKVLTNLQNIWTSQKVAYNSLSAAERATIYDITNGIDGGDAEGDRLHQVVAKYSYIVHKYGTGACEDFIWGGTYAAQSRYISPLTNDTTLLTTLIASIAVIGLGLTAVYLIRRKKQA